MKQLGLFGGTFNPIHIGHLKMAKAARRQFKLDVIYFIPCGVPPHKPKKGLLPSKLRYRLVNEAVDKLNKEARSRGAKKQRTGKPFSVLDIEIKKKKKAYTIDTVKKIKSYLASRISRLYFLIGQDEFNKLNTWHKAKELASLVTFIVLPRKGKLKAPKLKGLKWKLLKVKKVDISSTEIRTKSQY